MKLPIEGMMSTVISGVILTALFALIANIIPGAGWVIDIILILVIWLIMFGLLQKPTPPKA